ncbi:hypothetical protein [Pseudoxanthomonas taiwanensis]|uniref:hypothetical protein n=1 Tax=Pseudoxanthomonas taiwanensis TaxID=176598 RepID=UPI001389E57A|nr:hypothetical protein [Pseudoxanthomonas taiwanensis]
MAKRTPDQIVADLSAKLARAKDRARSARTHRLCQFGGAFDSIIDDKLLAALRLMPDADLERLRSNLRAGVLRYAPPASPTASVDSV